MMASSGGQGRGSADADGGGFGSGSDAAKFPTMIPENERRKNNADDATRAPVSIHKHEDEHKRDHEHWCYQERAGRVAYFADIRESGEVLGHGRWCGTVVRAEWCRQSVALKSYDLHPEAEDERDFYDIYEQEHRVLVDLRSLWGTHVPEMLFHIPWPTGPIIGLQLGVPIKEDDMSKWNHTDLEKAKETIAAVRKCGWAQRDMRGNKFCPPPKGR